MPQGVARWHPDLAGALRFLAEQLIVIGPTMVPALLLALARTRRGTVQAEFVAMAGVLRLAVLGQAFAAGKALANWAVVSLMPAAELAAGVLVTWGRLLALSSRLALAVSVALPLANPGCLSAHEAKS